MSRDYTEEIGLNSNQRMVPLPYAIVILAAMALASWFGYTVLKSNASHHQGIAKGSTPVATVLRAIGLK
jgi:hypothetical protein